MFKSDAKKCVIKITQEQQENVKNVRKTLKILQKTADKENLTRHSNIDKDAKLATSDHTSEKHEIKKRKCSHKAVQTGECVITEADLTSDDPGLDYWKTLAEKRAEALNDSLQENEKLKDSLEVLEEENKICKEMLDESRNLVEVLQEMLSEADTSTSTEIGQEATELDKSTESVQ